MRNPLRSEAGEHRWDCHPEMALGIAAGIAPRLGR
jgi:hypothetical protein